MIDRTLPMPTAEAAEQAASACLLIGLALRCGSLKKRYQLFKAAQVFIEHDDLQTWLDEVAMYRGLQDAHR